MLKRRKILLLLSVLLVAGSLGATVAYAMHLRSRALCERIAADVGKRMDLLVEIGRLQPLTFSSRRFQDIDLWLPKRQAQIGRCGAVVWRADVASGDSRFALDISDGWLLVGRQDWAPDDYRRLLRSGFAHDFAALGISEITVHGIDFRWAHPSFTLTAPAANGVIFFEEGQGRAVLTVKKLNEASVEEPIHVSAWFVPGSGMTFQKVEVSTGRISIRGLGLDALAGGPVSQGVFQGQISYREGRAGREWALSISGGVEGARLENFTRRVIGGPFGGDVDVTIDDAAFAQAGNALPALETLRFRGRLEALQLGEFAAVFREPELNGRVDLVVEQADYQRPDLRHVRLSGHASDVSLEALTRLLGYGVVTGKLELRINALAVVDNRLQWADVDLIAMPPEHSAAYIEKSALARVAREVFGLELDRLLPERVEYVRMGVKLLLDREGLRVRGTHGKENRTILTVKILGQEVGILTQPEKVYPVEDLVALARDRLASYGVDDLVGWWTRQHGTDDSPQRHRGTEKKD